MRTAASTVVIVRRQTEGSNEHSGDHRSVLNIVQNTRHSVLGIAVAALAIVLCSRGRGRGRFPERTHLPPDLHNTRADATSAKVATNCQASLGLREGEKPSAIPDASVPSSGEMGGETLSEQVMVRTWRLQPCPGGPTLSPAWRAAGCSVFWRAAAWSSRLPSVSARRLSVAMVCL